MPTTWEYEVWFLEGGYPAGGDLQPVIGNRWKSKYWEWGWKGGPRRFHICILVQSAELQKLLRDDYIASLIATYVHVHDFDRDVGVRPSCVICGAELEHGQIACGHHTDVELRAWLMGRIELVDQLMRLKDRNDAIPCIVCGRLLQPAMIDGMPSHSIVCEHHTADEIRRVLSGG